MLRLRWSCSNSPGWFSCRSARYVLPRVLEARRGDLVVSGEGLATGQAADRLAVARRASSAGGL